MLAETLSEYSRLGWQVLLLGQGQYSILDFEHNPAESVLWDFVSKMPDMKEPLELNQQALSKAFVGLIDTADRIAEMASCDIDVQHIMAEIFQSAAGGMQRAFHVADQSLQTQPEQLPLDNSGRQFSPDNSSAFGTDKTVQTVFSDTDRFANKFNDLLNFGFSDWLTIAYIAAVATISVKRDRLVKLILLE